MGGGCPGTPPHPTERGGGSGVHGLYRRPSSHRGCEGCLGCGDGDGDEGGGGGPRARGEEVRRGHGTQWEAPDPRGVLGGGGRVDVGG